MSAVSFQLRGADLAAKDKRLVGKNTSDPYYVLKAASAGGQQVELGRSKEIMKELNPTWEAVEVRGYISPISPLYLPISQPHLGGGGGARRGLTQP